MRLLLLLSALVTALCGVVSSVAMARNDVQASVSVEEEATPIRVASSSRFTDDGRPHAIAGWHVAEAAPAVSTRPLYADRRRE